MTDRQRFVDGHPFTHMEDQVMNGDGTDRVGGLIERKNFMVQSMNAEAAMDLMMVGMEDRAHDAGAGTLSGNRPSYFIIDDPITCTTSVPDEVISRLINDGMYDIGKDVVLMPENRIGHIGHISRLAGAMHMLDMIEVGASMGKTMQAAMMAPPPKTGKAKFTRNHVANYLDLPNRAGRRQQPTRDKKQFKLKGCRP